ncbi:MAG: hypothetical protein SGI99_02520 [Pseudomonadota bacterium]|nr:hypothetical protein [Pseudomonadota bacterium]
MSAVSNAQLMDAHAAPGYVGLVGGADWLNRAIRRMQHPGFRPEQRSDWSHAFIFSGRRADGQLWILESDLEMHRKQIRLGVQENRASKYFDSEAFPNLAILDFGLSEQQTTQVLTAALDLLAGLTRYSLREIVGTLLAVQSRRLRRRENVLAQQGSVYCSAMVQHCFAQIGLHFSDGLAMKNTMPEDIAATPLPHRRFALVRV